MITTGKVLVIDDDSDVGEIVSATAQAMELPCDTTTEPMTFFKLFTPDTSLILLDLMMPEMDGIEVLRLLGDRHCKASIVLMSGIDKRVIETARKLAQTLGLSVVGHLQKPFRVTDLEAVLKTHTVTEAVEAASTIPRIVIPDAQLRNAIERNEFVLYYQPQIDLATGEVTGVEALARWQHPQRGLILPADFIARTERLGLIDKLCWLTADRGLAEMWQFASPGGFVPRLSLNVSVYSLCDLKFPDTFMSLARKHGVPAENIALEITETGLIREHSRSLDVLTRLRVKNIQLSIDDFGTGYSMMQQLQNVPATELKIDRAFVSNLQSNDSDRVMVQKIIEIGHELGAKVMAEGVETREQLDLLRQKGCDSVQGYLFSRPLPPDKMVAWLKAYRAGEMP
jgi:EAL domain-containing protein (putative c-di-GMP-specific phosphodiesterase class I)/CheY-like chemotaxis protein